MHEAYLWGGESPDTFVEIGDYVDLKAESLGAHMSQMSGDPVKRGENIRRWAARQGEAAGLPYAEQFRRLRFDFRLADLPVDELLVAGYRPSAFKLKTAGHRLATVDSS